MREATPLFPIFLSALFNVTSTISGQAHSYLLAASRAASSLSSSSSSASSGLTSPQQYSASTSMAMMHTTISAISHSQWTALNSSVSGRLHADGVPYARACFDSYEYEGQMTPGGQDPEACASLQAGYLHEKYRLGHFGSSTSTQWETCQATGQGCLLDWMNPKNTNAFGEGRTCHQGIVSRYYIDVREPDDVKAAFEFAKTTGVRLVIKNTGHDYMGRSTAPDSLTLWTRNLQGITYDPDFQPEGCTDGQRQPGLTMGAGTVFGQVYDFAEQNNITFVGGTDRTVGAAGGWVQGGGHSLLSPTLGLGVDRALQFKVVTPTGKYLVANAYQNQDLFFALRGGGGGTFGVVMETTFKVEPRSIGIRVAKITYPASADNWKKVVEIGVNNAAKWADEAWGGVIGTSLVVFTNPRLSLDEAKASFQPYADFAQSVNGTLVIEDAPTWLQFFDKFIGGNPVGLPGTPASRLVPRRYFEDEQLKPQLLSAIHEGTTGAQFKQLLMSCPTTFSSQNDETSVTEAWRSCIWSVTTGTFWNYATSVDDIKRAYEASSEAIRRVRELTLEDGGAYGSEADLHELDHTRAFWGSHYPRLLSIKTKYDPHGLLDCWHCVGWKGADDGRYACMV
ncbi:FAD-binding domain-containing protein [Serendipita vermifera]|nr:FAD-binding domain-containing protein [Serendipita vermifera]